MKNLLSLHTEQDYEECYATMMRYSAIAHAAMVEVESYRELLAFIGVSNIKDAKQSVSGLRERVKFTESFEALRDHSYLPSTTS